MAWHAVDVPTESPATVHVAGTAVLVINVDGDWYGVEDRCSHADCSFSSDGEIDGGTVICNCHGSEFDVRTGEVLVSPAFDPIRTLPVRESHGNLEVEL